MMSRTTILSVLFCFSLLYFSCGKDDDTSIDIVPESLGLHFDTTTCAFELCRDTADFAHLRFDFSLAEKIGEIEILDNQTGRTVEILEDFSGQYVLAFDYPIDISDMMRDTALNYLVKVSDQTGETYCKTFVFLIRPFSVPQIILPDGQDLFTDLPVYKIRAILTTGSKPIGQVSLVFDGKEQNIAQPEAGATEYVLNHQISLIYYNKEYVAKLRVEDIDGRQQTRSLTITKIQGMERPVKIRCEGAETFDIAMKYDADDRIESIDMENRFHFRFSYGSYANRYTVFSIEQSDWNGENTVVTSFDYDGQSRLKSIDETRDSITCALIETCRYDQSRLSGFSVGEVEVDGIAYEDLKTLGRTLSEIWNAPFPEINETNRTKAADYWTIKIPTYISALPYPFFFASGCNVSFQDLFLSRYLHLKNVKWADESVTTDTYAYETDRKGRLSVLTRTILESSDNSETPRIYSYRFIYGDSEK